MTAKAASLTSPQLASHPVATQPSPAILRNPMRRGPVLVATDGMGSSDAPLLLGKRLAERLGVPLEVVTVLEPAPVYSAAPEIAYPMYIEAHRREAREDIVRRRVHDVLGSRTLWKLVVRYGSVAREVAAYGRFASASVIIVGAAPHRRFRRTVAGERAADVLRFADCPVLSVENELTSLPRFALVAVDFSPASAQAAQAALLLLDDEATLSLVHVLPPRDLGQPMETTFDGGLATLFSRLREELRPYVPPGVCVQTGHAEGTVAERIAERADEVEADLIVVGTRGPGFVERLFLGSVATMTLHRSGRTVLASPPPPPAEAFRLELRLTGSAATEESTDWGQVLDGFSRRNVGRAVTVEVDDPLVGAQVQARGYVLTGVTYDRHDRRVELMLGGGERHLTRMIERADSVAACTTPDGKELALEIRHGSGHTLVTLNP